MRFTACLPCRTVQRSLGCAVWVVSFVLLCLPASTWGAQVTLAWDPIQTPELAGYLLYYGYAHENEGAVVDVGLQTTYTLSDLQAGVAYYFSVTAYDIYGTESPYATELVFEGSERDAAERAAETAADEGEEGFSDRIRSDQQEDPLDQTSAGEVLDSAPWTLALIDSASLLGEEGDGEELRAHGLEITGHPAMHQRADIMKLLALLRTRLKTQAQLKGAPNALLRHR